MVLGQLSEDGGCDAGLVRQALNGDLRFVGAVGNAADLFLFHDFILIHDKGSGRIRKAGAHLKVHIVAHGHGHRAGLQHLGAERCHFQHLLEGDAVELLRLRGDPRVCCIDTIDIGVDIAAVRLQCRGKRHRRCVRATAAECRHPPVGSNALETGDNSHLAAGKALAHQRAVDAVDARRAMNVVGADRNLPAEPRTRVDAEILQRDRQKADRHLLAGGDNGVIFAGIMHRTDVACPGHQLVCGPGHCRNNHRHLMPGIDFRFHPRRDIADAIEVADRSATKFLNNKSHFCLMVAARC